MCTAISYRNQNTYFGRNLDVDFSFNEKIVVTPRNYIFKLQNGRKFKPDYAIIGAAAVIKDHPLYYEGANEKGLAMAGLNFPGNAFYNVPVDDRENIAIFEIIPYILGKCGNVSEAVNILNEINLTNLLFGNKIPPTPLHFMLSDNQRSVVAEPLKDGIKIYDNPYDVLTNNPPFEFHMWNMQRYMGINPKNSENKFSKYYQMENFCVGTGALGLPGDNSSPSRFVRAAFNLTNSVTDGEELSNVSQFFHVLDSVAMVRGSVINENDKNDITLYSCCINTDKGIYYYKTYDNNRINAVQMHKCDLESEKLAVFDMYSKEDINYIN